LLGGRGSWDPGLEGSATRFVAATRKRAAVVQRGVKTGADYKGCIVLAEIVGLQMKSLFGCGEQAAYALTAGRAVVVYTCSYSHPSPLSGWTHEYVQHMRQVNKILHTITSSIASCLFTWCTSCATPDGTLGNSGPSMVRLSACLTQSSEENLLVLAEVDPRNIFCEIVAEGINSDSTASEMRFYSDIRRLQQITPIVLTE
jgi:hypothetical protein